MIQHCGSGPIADVGCGTGDLLLELTRRGVEVLGADDSPEIVEAARLRLPGARIAVAPVTQLPFDDASLAAVLLVEVVEHLDNATLDGAFKEARRVLRPGGHLVITTPNKEDIAAAAVQCPDCGCEFHPMQHVRSWTGTTLANAMSSHGFEVKTIQQARLVENGPRLERVIRGAYYALRRQQPHLVAVGTRTAGVVP